MKDREYTRVWGDTVYLPELVASIVIGIIITMGSYLLIRFVLQGYTSVEPTMINGYSLIGGIAACFLSGFISSLKFRPKREVVEGTEELDLKDILKEADSSLEIEIDALNREDPEVIKEMESLELYSLLSLISEDSKNYKPEYKELLERKIRDEH